MYCALQELEVEQEDARKQAEEREARLQAEKEALTKAWTEQDTRPADGEDPWGEDWLSSLTNDNAKASTGNPDASGGSVNASASAKDACDRGDGQNVVAGAGGDTSEDAAEDHVTPASPGGDESKEEMPSMVSSNATSSAEKNERWRNAGVVNICGGGELPDAKSPAAASSAASEEVSYPTWCRMHRSNHVRGIVASVTLFHALS